MIVAGSQVPAIPLVEVSGNAGAVAFRQRSAIGSKVGVIASRIVTITEVGMAQPAPVGVKV